MPHTRQLFLGNAHRQTSPQGDKSYLELSTYLFHLNLKGKLAHDFDDNTFIQNYYIVSLETRLIRRRKRNVEHKWSILSNKHTDVFQREFPICDVAQGLIGEPLLCQKGFPQSESVILKNDEVHIISKNPRIFYCSLYFGLIYRYPRILVFFQRIPL